MLGKLTTLQKLIQLYRFKADASILETVTGNAPLTLANAIARAIKSLTQTGLCAQTSTPTPVSRADIYCNNGRVVAGNCISDIPDGQGTFITPSELTTNRVYKAFPTDLVVGRSYTVTVTGTNWLILVQQKKPDGTGSSNVSGWVTTYDLTPEEGYIYGVAMRRSQDNITPADFNGTLTLDTTDGKPWTVGTPEVLTVQGKNLLDASLFDTESISIKYTTFSIPNGKYTMSSPDFPVGTGSASNVFIMAGEATSGASSLTNGVTSSSSRTITVTDGKYTIAYRSTSSNNTNNPKDFKWQLEYGETATDYQPYHAPQNVTDIPMLLGVGDYKDEAELIHGIKTGKVGVYVFTGEETGIVLNGAFRPGATSAGMFFPKNVTLASTHFKSEEAATSTANMPDGSIKTNQTAANTMYMKNLACEDVAAYQAWLAAQYAAGTPVIVLYPLATETTEQTTAQHLTTAAGTNTVSVTAEVSPVELTVKYMAKATSGG